jgi:ribosomal protection tetracycline resistance protein
MRTLNLGILAHVDAGKTTLTERLLYATGVIDEIGSVDDGNTQTDTLALERQRGITIRSAVVSFVIDDVTVNLIDTPGHPDFIAEVERVLQVLDGAVLVVSAVEGVQAQTRILMRTLQRLRIPTLIFVNKIDRRGATDDGALQGIADKLSRATIAMGATREIGTRRAAFVPYDPADVTFRSTLSGLLAEHDEEILTAYADGDPLSGERLEYELGVQTGHVLVHPVFFGSAITGAGVDALAHGIAGLLPAAEGDIESELSGTVFKIERGAAGEKIAFVRLFSGTLRTRDRVRIRGDEYKVTAIRAFERGDAAQHASVAAGRIAKVWGLGGVRIGDEIGGSRTTDEHHFDPPTLETVVVPRRAGEKGSLHAALAQLAEQDPLINLRQDDLRHELSVSLYGEVQKEVIGATLANDYGLEVGFRETTMICVERPSGIGDAVEAIGTGNPFLATVGLRVEPATIGTGITFRLDASLDTLPLYVYGSVDAFRTAMEDTVRETLREGLLGWQVIDCAVTMTRSDYRPPGTGRRDFRYLTPLVVMSALEQAGTTVCEPVLHFHLEIPSDTFGAVSRVLARLEASLHGVTTQATSSRLEGDIAASKVHELQVLLPGLARGEGVLASTFDHYQPIRGEAPTRPRTNRDPRNRGEYLRQVLPGYD